MKEKATVSERRHNSVFEQQNRLAMHEWVTKNKTSLAEHQELIKRQTYAKAFA